MSTGSTPDPVLEGSEVDRRIIAPSEFVADTEAFIDVRIPGSQGKASYSFIGPGVSQNADQTINLVEPHGFNVGAASMPHGVVNNPHLHFTAEVFICTRGSWSMHIGQHGDQTIPIGPGTIFSAPTWVFRGFENTGPDDGWLFVVLGEDDTGGILWAPEVLAAAADTGLYLSPTYEILDATAGDVTEDVITPLTPEQLAAVDTYSDEELAERVVPADALDWSSQALLSAVVPGHASRVAPVIGYGMSEDRRHRPPIADPHGFAVEWLELDESATTGSHRLDVPTVLFAIDGDWTVTFNRGDRAEVRPVPNGSVVSVPAGCWREFANPASAPARVVITTGGSGPVPVEWDPTIVDAAAEAGWARDAYGYLAPLDLVGRTR